MVVDGAVADASGRKPIHQSQRTRNATKNFVSTNINLSPKILPGDVFSSPCQPKSLCDRSEEKEKSYNRFHYFTLTSPDWLISEQRTLYAELMKIDVISAQPKNINTSRGQIPYSDAKHILFASRTSDDVIFSSSSFSFFSLLLRFVLPDYRIHALRILGNI